jgi:hypothetical protein
MAWERMVARGSRFERGRELPESRTRPFARRVLEDYLSDGLDQLEESLETADEEDNMSLLLASVLLRDQGMDCEVWDHWMRIEYLEAARDAVEQSLESLQAPPTSGLRPSRTRH